MKTINTRLQAIAFMACLCMLSIGTVHAQQVMKPTSSGYAPVNGLKMYYEVYGQGKPIVLLHGSYMTIGLNWSQLIPELAKSHKVIALEIQGHGHTADIDRTPSYKAMASDVAGVLKHLKIDSADVLGYSLGGTIAYQLAIDNPGLVSKLIIVSSVYKYKGWQPEVLNVLKMMTPEFLDGTPLKTEYEKVAPRPGDWRKFLAKFIAFDKEDFDLGDDKIKAIQSPVLLINGDNDGVDKEHVIQSYKLFGGSVFADMNGFPRSRLAIVPATSHVTLMMETQKLWAIIQPFIDNVPPMTMH
ncbi:alpha/beta fold hydrolase [Paraflavitalea devenefica]|uniref:alpha/beta fold hydrolase n=1 Tax=Paraflavitalea devenefica TaxID=2716334 RepID=UPI001ABB2C15|nr:alpha/beta hydrolase [Paraflavitalea devenefica]